jgi:hypothetical protein
LLTLKDGNTCYGDSGIPNLSGDLPSQEKVLRKSKFTLITMLYEKARTDLLLKFYKVVDVPTLNGIEF